MPILEYIQALLFSSHVPINREAWINRRAETAWVPDENAAGDGEQRVFYFTRSIAGDHRLLVEGALGAEKMVKQLFTADRWHWTPED